MVVTGFYPEPNYILASTASIAFLTSAATIHWLVAWHYQVPLSLALVLSSIWFHTQRTYMAYMTDQAIMFLWAFGAIYEAYVGGPIQMSIAIIIVLYDILVFYVGWLGNCFAFDPNRQIATFFHSTVHFVSFMGGVGVILLSPSPELHTIKFVENKQ